MPEEEIVLNGNTYRLVKGVNGHKFHSCLLGDEKVMAAHLKEAANFISFSFAWDKSDEGFEFWKTVHEKLVKYASSIKL